MEQQVEKNRSIPNEAESSNGSPTAVVNLDTLVLARFQQQLKYFYFARLKETEDKMCDLVRISEEKFAEHRNLLNEMRKQQILLMQYGIEMENLDLSCRDIKIAIEKAILIYGKTVENHQAVCEELENERKVVMEEQVRNNMTVLDKIRSTNEFPMIVGLNNVQKDFKIHPNVMCKAKKRKRKTDGRKGILKKPCDQFPASENFTKEKSILSERYIVHGVQCLFIRQFPFDTTEDDIKALSSDIVSVHIPKTRKGKNRSYGFVEFASESKAKENLPVLQEAKIKGQKFQVQLHHQGKNLVSQAAPVPPKS